MRGPYARHERLLLIPSASLAGAVTVHICIIIRSGFRVRFLETLAKTRNGRKVAPQAIKRDTAWLARQGPTWYGSPLPAPSASRARASTVHICIFIRAGFPVRKRPSQGWREPFLEAPAKTHNVEKAALCVGVRHHTA